MQSSIMYVITDREYTKVRETGYETIRTDGDKYGTYMKIYEKCCQNDDCRYIGFSLFDCYFVEGGRLVSLSTLEKKLKTYDVILPDRQITSLIHMGCSEMMMMKSELFKAYYESLQEDTCQRESLYDWVKKQHVRIGYSHIEQIDTSRMQEMYRLMEALTKDLIGNYRGGRTLKLPKLDRSVGADGKMPVWICWWQGEDNAPDIVKKCMQSIRMCLPKEKTDIRVVSFDNYEQYVAFSDTIVKRFNEGKLSLTHLSDVLRAQLLCRYGGLWIDATCMLWDDRFVDDLLQYPFYTRKKGGELNELDIVSGRWATYFLKGPANFSLFGFLVEAFEAYWEKYDTLLNYFIFDYMIAVAYDHLTDVKMILDALPANNAASEVLAGWCNEPYDENKMKLLTNQTWLFKMTYKKEFTEKTPQGEDTFYHVVMNH